MNLRPALALLLLTIVAAAVAQTPRPSAIDAFRMSVAAVEHAKVPVSLEPLLNAAESVQDGLMQIQPDDRAWIETLNEAEYAALKAELRGMQLSRGIDIYAQPDGAFLLQLAGKHGRPEDLAFFEVYVRLWNEQQLPRYLSLGSRPTPCVRFGAGILPELYADWRTYAERYPKAYVAYTAQTLRDLEEAVALGTCACGDEHSVQRELEGFLQRFPQTPVAADIRGRLKQLKETPELRPVYCR